MKTFYIRTFGCQMNEADSAEIAEFLLSLGLQPAENVKKADLVLVNTCSVRAKAEQKAFSYIGGLKRWKENEKGRKLGVMGCMAARIPQVISAQFPYVDAVIPGKSIEEMKETVRRLLPEDMENLPSLKPAWLSSLSTCSPVGMVSVIRGCSHNCSFCVVPYVRGPSRSVPPEEVLETIRRYVQRGIKEIYLLGQSILDYGKDFDTPFFLEDLLEKIHQEVPELLRIRFITSHPKDVTLRFVRAVRNLPKVMEYFHIPFQSGSNKVLRDMRRGITREEYKEKVAMIREEIPHAGISSDIIVGFPTETEEDFEETRKLVQEVQLDSAYVFKYSPREHTLSALKWHDAVPPRVKSQRFHLLWEDIKALSLQRNQQWVGKTGEILVEGEEKGYLYGRLPDFRMVHIEGKKDLIGSLVRVFIHQAGTWTLKGTLISE
ncbi:MAG: tRNA (N6-isopentenyl adenosine(37)-C2)-methylthiotransferase MiaB [bacterium JZ-2024 1]